MDEVTPLSQPNPNEEVLVGEWDEAEHPAIAGSSRQYFMMLLGSTILVVVSVLIALWQHDIDYYFGTAVFALFIISLISQAKRSQPRLHIVVTTQRIIVGNRQYLLNELSGYWVSKDQETTVINLETPKPGMVPISFLYATFSEQEARAIMSQVLPELEPRLVNIGDSINRYFRF